MALFLGIMDYLGAIQVWHLLLASTLTGFLVSLNSPCVNRSCTILCRLRTCQRRHALSDGLQRFHAFRPIHWWSADSFGRSQGCFFVATAGNLAVLITIFMIHIQPAARPSGKSSLSGDMVEGLQLAWTTPVFLALLSALAIVTFCSKPYTQFMPVFARDILQVGAPGLGFLLMAPGAGAIVGGLTLASTRRFPKPYRLLFFLAAGFGTSIFFFAVSRHFFLSLLCLFIAGGFQTTFLSVIATLLQMHTSEHNRGRIMALFGMINRGLGPMGSFPFGLLASAIGASITVAMCGFLTVSLIGYITLLRPELRAARRIGET
jgi:predicted MFS family arabinose efflux permease